MADDRPRLIRPSFKTLSGRVISAWKIEQWEAHHGRLEGSPTIESNHRMIEWHLQEQHRKSGRRPILIPPRQYELDFDYPFGTPALLPAVACLAHFEAGPFSHNNMDGSELAVLWFQDQYALPVEPTVVAALENLDWESLAVEVQW